MANVQFRARVVPKSDHHYGSVGANSEVEHDEVIPNGETWKITRFTANGAYLDDTMVCLCWDRGGDDDELLAASHGDASIPMEKELVGDGSKKLTILLTNDTSSAHVMGGRWDVEVV